MVDLQSSGRGFGNQLGTVASNLRKVIHTHLPPSPSSIIWHWLWENITVCWEDNRGTGGK